MTVMRNMMMHGHAWLGTLETDSQTDNETRGCCMAAEDRLY